MALDQITNFHAYSDTLATSGQPTPEQFTEIAAAGYRMVVNLAMPNSDHAIADEGAIVTGQGMVYVHIPVDFAAPTETELREFIGVMQAYKGQKVWVHCVVNARVSAFCFQYLTQIEGWTKDQATSPILKGWTARGIDPVWQDFLALDVR